MKVLAVDPGDARIGLAVSDEAGILARPLDFIKHISRQANAARIAQTAEEMFCGLILIGTPLDSEGEVGPRARVSLRLAEAIQAETKIPVKTWDESGSSQMADQLALRLGYGRKKRSEPKDSLAAALILQDYLDSREQEKDAPA
ncbi:MAG: Holliday junction resolvase RuvX [Anaerolineaceae bacterium]|nr:Holliday junction resolvase RuvX [Anaerolineaceae bacterium]